MKIVILCLPGIGDALMATPFVRLLRKTYPHARIDVVCMFDGVKFVFENNPYIDNVFRLHLFKANILSALQQLLVIRKNNYDISFLTFPSYRKEYHLVQFILGAKKRVGHRYTKGYISEFNFLDTDSIQVEESKHNVINNLNLLQAVNVQWMEANGKTKLAYDLILDKKDEAFAMKYIKEIGWNKKIIIGIHPGSTRSKAAYYKRWSVGRYGELVTYFIKKKNFKVMVVVGDDEKEVGEELLSLVNDKNCRLLTKMKLPHAVAVMQQFSVMICNDNGFAHLANAVKVPSIVLFGPTNPKWCSPYNKEVTKVVRKAKFEPWFRNDMKVTHPPKGVKSGMDDIVASDVISEFNKLYEKKPKA